MSELVVMNYNFFSGDKFDVRWFHWEILRLGFVPLSVLEKSINEWVDHVLMTSSASAVTMVARSYFLLATTVVIGPFMSYI